MSTTNALYLRQGGHLVPLDLDSETLLLANFASNDRSDPSTIQSDYSAELSLPATARNHRLLRHAVASQPTQGTAYQRVEAVLTSGGVETIPRAYLLVKGFEEGRIKIQLVAGNKRFIGQLKRADGEDKRLSDLSWPAFEHQWTPQQVGAHLGYATWQQDGWGYEVFDRGKPLDFHALDPYTCYPSVAAWLILAAIVEDAGFTSNDLRSEPLFAALNVPAANPYQFSDDFRQARALTAGYTYDGLATSPGYYKHDSAFPEERLQFDFTAQAPYQAPTATTYVAGRYTAATLGYYDLKASVTTFLEINSNSVGSIRCKFMLKVNGQSVFAGNGGELGKDELETDETVTHTFTPELTRYLLQPGDYVELWWKGDEIRLPSGTHWRIGPVGGQVELADGVRLASEVRLSVSLLAEFPQGGLVRLQDWLPDLTQLEFVKAMMLTLGLTVMTDPYEDRLTFTPGSKLLQNVPRALNWSAKLDRARPLGRQPERVLQYRFGKYARTSRVLWTQDEQVTKGYGDGQLTIDDAALDATVDLATLAFAASEPSPTVPKLLRIANFEKKDVTATDYAAVTAKPRLVLRQPDGEISGQLVAVPQVGQPGDSNYAPAVLAAFATTPSYFASPGLSLNLNDTVLTTYWADVRAMLDQTRYLKERLRLTAADIAALDYSAPVWIAAFQDYFCVSRITEFDARRSTEVELVRLNAQYLPPPVVPGGLQEWYSGEWFAEWY